MSQPVVVICNFRFEHKPENETIELVSGRHAARVCKECLVLMTTHRRMHHMEIEKIIGLMSERQAIVKEA